MSTLGSGARGFGWTLAACGMAAAVGTALAFYGRSLPVFKVPYDPEVRSAYFGWCPPDGGIDRAAGEHYYALFAWHYAVIDAGVALFLAAATIAALAIALRFTSGLSETRIWLRTPSRRIHYLVIGFWVVVWNWLFINQSFATDLRRQRFPSCADTIAIPMAANDAFFMLLIPILLAAGFLITRGFGPLSAPLGAWDRDRPGRSWTITLACAAPMVGVAAAGTMLAPTSMNTVIPAAIVALYLLESTRTALIVGPRRGPATGPFPHLAP